MQLPQQYPYNPKWHTLLLGAALFGGGSFFMTRMATQPNEGLRSIPMILGSAGAASFYWVVAGLSAMFAAVTLVLVVRRFVVAQFLELQRDELVLPRGWFQTRHIRIPYAQIERVWEVNVSGQTLLFVAVAGRQFKITASLLPDLSTYATVRNFIFSRARATGAT